MPEDIKNSLKSFNGEVSKFLIEPRNSFPSYVVLPNRTGFLYFAATSIAHNPVNVVSTPISSALRIKILFSSRLLLKI
jgi:hypothetical protein